MEMKFHEVVELFPKMSEEDFNKLKEDIQENGLLEPIWLEKEGGPIIDGRHRFLACTELGIEPQFRIWEGQGDNLVTFVMSLNMRRRHIKPSIAAMIGRNALAMMKKYVSESAEKGEKVGRARDLAGEAAGVSGKMIDAADAVHEKGVEELESAVLEGGASVTAAAEVAKSYTEEEQREIASGGKKSITEAAKAAKKKRLPKPEPLEDSELEEEDDEEMPPRDVDEIIERIMAMLNGLPKEDIDRIVGELNDFRDMFEEAA